MFAFVLIVSGCFFFFFWFLVFWWKGGANSCMRKGKCLKVEICCILFVRIVLLRALEQYVYPIVLPRNKMVLLKNVHKTRHLL